MYLRMYVCMYMYVCVCKGVSLCVSVYVCVTSKYSKQQAMKLEFLQVIVQICS